MAATLSSSFISNYTNITPPWGFDGLGYFVFKRTYSRRLDTGHTEEWWQTVQRVVNGFQSIDAGYTEHELETLYDAIFNLKALPAGRMLWQLGTENVDRFGGDSLCNCWFTNINTPEDFGFIFDELMLGGGVGFNITESSLPRITQPNSVHARHESDADLIVPDKREGWVQLFEETIRAYAGERPPFDYSTQLIRPKGSPIKTFGGVASGPGVLQEGIEKVSKILDDKAGAYLEPVDILDITNIIGWMVVSGNVRRSAQIALGSPTDKDFLFAKRWDLGDIPPHRAMSNNSVYVNNTNELPDAFWEGYAGNGEPYGMFNLEASRKYGRAGEERYDETIEGVNPCGEIPLASWESCNLAEIFLPNINSQAEFIELSHLLYKGQKAVAALPYRQAKTTDVVSTNMRLGLSVSGIAQVGERELAWLRSGYESLKEFDIDWSRQRGWNESVRLTTVKPSGTISLLAGVTPGIHPAFSQHHIRRVRVAENDPMVDIALGQGYHVERARNIDGTDDHTTQVVSFPCKVSGSTMVASGTSAIDQLHMVNRIQRDWVDNAISCTVYYDDDDLPLIRDFLDDNWSTMKSISFLKREDHGFDQPPLEEIDHERYLELKSNIHTHAVEDMGDVPLVDECDEGACPIR